ncbi:MAG TPA: hypothetical protein VN857_14260 [Chthoniobacterales bacterium]|nr:hypothetical protein [Chthoniobacterales bacterium]
MRLWGAVTLPPLRCRGGYRSLVRARLQEGYSRGANLAIVTARVDTSGPILQKMGFRHVGITKQYQLGLQ